MTIQQALAHISRTVRSKLANKDTDTIRIMEHVVELNETGILQSLDKKLTLEQLGRLERIVRRLKKDEPLEYITGSADFYDCRFYVSKDTLIPRVETESLVNLTLDAAHQKLHNGTFQCRTDPDQNKRKLSILDVGTGSGCIIISTALHLREPVSYFASDISGKALKIARKNLSAYQLTRTVRLFEGSLLEPVPEDIKLDIIVGNLPYIRHVDIDTLPKSVKHYEPHIALDGGINGVDLIRTFLIQALERLHEHGVILLEADPRVLETLLDFANRFYPDARITVHTDPFEITRFVSIQT